KITAWWDSTLGQLGLWISSTNATSTAVNASAAFTTPPTIASGAKLHVGSRENGSEQADAVIAGLRVSTQTPSDNQITGMYGATWVLVAEGEDTVAQQIGRTDENKKYGNYSLAVNTVGRNESFVLYTTRKLSASMYYLTAYVLDNTSGNIGGPVNGSIVQLYFNGSLLGTSYTDEGGGWWRIGGGLNATAMNVSYGIAVKPGKVVLIDAVQLENQYSTYAGYGPYPTTYADGSLGTGYSWSGVPNNSTSTRATSEVRLPTSDNIANSKGTIIMWIKVHTRTAGYQYMVFTSGVSIGLGPSAGSSFLRMYTVGSGCGSFYQTYGGTIQLNKWILVATTWNNATKKMEIYTDLSNRSYYVPSECS
ncbi:hypothetical protein COT48_04735, partial [Candidatus Woesearchaeota archaeon CG08_land_8_20_14_0_20_47_9]